MRISDGSLETLKWIALVLMTGDHINKYLFNGTIDTLFAAGRLCLPIFVFVLAYNLSRPDVFERGVYPRVMKRMTLFGAVASVPFIALGGLGGGWWPLNAMFTLLVSTAILYLIERGGPGNGLAACLLFLIGGSIVEFWWPAIALCVAVWSYCKKPSLSAVLVALLALAALWFTNRNLWAFAVLPLFVLFSRYHLPMPRRRWAFYLYYPLHLAALWLIRIPMGKAGYLFF